jgi:hypothetical protein
MKSTIILYFLLLKTLVGFSQTTENITTIKQEFKLINENVQNMSISTSTNFDMATDGTEITTYSDNNSLRKLVLKHAGESGKLIEEYYLLDNNLIFYFSQAYSYNMPYYIDSTKAAELEFKEWHNPDKTTIDENRYYFWNNQLIRWIDNEGNNMPMNTNEFSVKETNIHKHFKEILIKIKR